MQHNKNLYAPRFWLIWIGLFILKCLVLLPYPLLIRIGKFIGRILLSSAPRWRKTARTNIRHCFPEYSADRQKELLLHNFEAVGISILESALAMWGKDTNLKGLLHVKGEAYLLEAIKQQKPIILLGVHFTTTEIIGRLISTHHSLAVMYHQTKNPVVGKFREEHLKKHYKQAIPRSKMREMIRCLENMIPVWYSPDVDPGSKQGIFAPFFGLPACTVSTVPRLAARTNAIVIPTAYYRRDDEQGYDLIFYPPLEKFPSSNLEEDVGKINQIIEEAIRKKPEQYMWQYKRFKTPLPGTTDIYAKD